jgi:hypothetical protein
VQCGDAVWDTARMEEATLIDSAAVTSPVTRKSYPRNYTMYVLSICCR